VDLLRPNGARALVALTIWSAAAATTVGLVVFEGVLDSKEPAGSRPVW
jgi:hypothetical protein